MNARMDARMDERRDARTDAPTKAHIWIIDDDSDHREITKHILQSAGFAVTCSHDPDAALAAMSGAVPDLVITDLMMGSLDAGFVLARRMRENARLAHVPLIVLTAVGKYLGLDFKPRSSADLAAMHVDAFMEKPARPEALLATVRRLLAVRSQNQ